MQYKSISNTSREGGSSLWSSMMWFTRPETLAKSRQQTTGGSASGLGRLRGSGGQAIPDDDRAIWRPSSKTTTTYFSPVSAAVFSTASEIGGSFNDLPE